MLCFIVLNLINLFSIMLSFTIPSKVFFHHVMFHNAMPCGVTFFYAMLINCIFQALKNYHVFFYIENLENLRSLPRSTTIIAFEAA